MKNLLVIDIELDKKREKLILDFMKERLGGENHIIFTSYEDNVIRKVRNWKFIGSALQHLLYWHKSYRYTKKILKAKYDNIFCINPIVGIFLGLKNKHCRIVLGGFLFESKKNLLYLFLRKRITTKSLKKIEKIAVYGSSEVEYYRQIFDLDNFTFIRYGSDFKYSGEYINDKLPDSYVFSGGGSNRDYFTLIDAYNRGCSLPLIIATQPWRLTGMNLKKITVLDDVVIENFGSVLRKAKVLVLSLRNETISAGHMVMLEAMSLGVPIIVNDIPAIKDYVNEDEVYFYESQNVEQLNWILNNIKKLDADLHNKAVKAKLKFDQDLNLISFLNRFISL